MKQNLKDKQVANVKACRYIRINLEELIWYYTEDDENFRDLNNITGFVSLVHMHLKFFSVDIDLNLCLNARLVVM